MAPNPTHPPQQAIPKLGMGYPQIDNLKRSRLEPRSVVFGLREELTACINKLATIKRPPCPVGQTMKVNARDSVVP